MTPPEATAPGPTRIYVATPYSAATEDELIANVAHAIDVGLVLFGRGHFPFVPHLLHMLDFRCRQRRLPFRWEDAMQWLRPWLDACDAILVDGDSPGVSVELEVARVQKKIVYRALDEVPVVVPELVKREGEIAKLRRYRADWRPGPLPSSEPAS